jgi:hypothetical protein
MKPASRRNPLPTPVHDNQNDRAHRHATHLLNASVSYARLILRRYGQLAPFAFSIDREGQVARETLDIPRLPRDPERLWKLLTEHIAKRIRCRAIQAVALCANVTLAQPSQENYTDAIILTIEQESGHVLEVIVPYKIYGGQLRNLLPRRIALGRTIVEDSTPHIFPAP